MTNEEALIFLDERNTSSVIPFQVKMLCSNALVKQIPKTPRKTETVYGVDGCGEVTNKLVLYTCPVCDEPIHVGRGCSNNKCRQAIDWSDEDDI